jgi:hypothetical protein
MKGVDTRRDTHTDTKTPRQLTDGRKEDAPTRTQSSEPQR